MRRAPFLIAHKQFEAERHPIYTMYNLCFCIDLVLRLYSCNAAAILLLLHTCNSIKSSHMHSRHFHNPTCKKTTYTNIFLHSLLLIFLSPCLHAAVQLQLHTYQSKDRLFHSETAKKTGSAQMQRILNKLCLLHPKLTYAASPS